MKKVVTLLLGMVCLLNVYATDGESIKCVVVEVLDGNTLVVKSQDNEEVKVILYGVDSPELDQDYGMESKMLLEKKALKKCVYVQFQGMDRKGNHFAIVTTDKNVDLRVELLKKGLAWTAEKNPLPDLESYRAMAEKKGVGLWQQKEPTPPWTYRRQQTMMNPKSS